VFVRVRFISGCCDEILLMVEKYIKRCREYAKFAEAESKLREDIEGNRVLSNVVRLAARGDEETDRVKHYLAYHLFHYGGTVEEFLEDHPVDNLHQIIMDDLELFD
jgi:hypothetical protein